MGSTDDPAIRSGGEHLYDALVDAGIELLVGLPGTQTLPLDRVVERRDDVRYLMARHETAIPHVAWGYHEAGGGVAATLTVPGPGDTNAMHGLKNALEDRVPLVHVSAVPDPADRGKGPIHEIEPETYDTVVKGNYSVERPAELSSRVSEALAAARTPPRGPVRIGVPKSVLAAEFRAPAVESTASSTRAAGDRDYEAAADLLATAERPVVYVGVGARRSPGAAAAVRDLAAALDAPVVASLKGKGVVPEDDPRAMGVTASHLPAGARTALEAADVTVALGTRFDGVSTDDWSIDFGDALVHVTVDPAFLDAAYEADVAIVDDVATAAQRLLETVESRTRPAGAWSGDAVGRAVRAEYEEHLRDLDLLASGEPLTTPAALVALREVLPRETVVTTDVGGFRLWAKQVFEAYDPESYVTAGSWAGMGVGLPAAVGAKLARPSRPAVALTGDGGLMMCLQELHTAAEEDLDVLTVVFNNADYGIISKSPEIERYADGNRFAWDSPDFARLAEGFGCRGETVRTAGELERAVDAALSREDGPEVIDARVPPGDPTAAAAADYEADELPRR